MRITRLELENINSLAGRWSVDLSHPDYARNHDIFVIHGPTGAGKTTLLDAITLALYGRTPRLEAINSGEGGNELMTRGTGFCRAAVTYSCSKGVFMSEFRQNRANSMPSGKLQKASYIITRLAGGGTAGEVVSSGVGSSLERETQKIIQLDYKQFCRSMMLAQGEFGAFLESGGRDRAEILEKLTGTQRYRRIAQSIAERFREIKRSLSIKKAERDEIEALLLSEADESAARSAAEALGGRLAMIETELERARRELAFLDELDRLHRALVAARAEKERAEREAADFAAQEERLLLAQAARQCEAEFVAATAHRGAQAGEQSQIASLSAEMMEADAALAEAEKGASAARDGLSAEEKDFAAQQELWKTVRALDVRLSSASEKCAGADERRRGCESAAAESVRRISALDAAETALSASVVALREYLARHGNDGRIPQAIAKVEALRAGAEQRLRQAEECGRHKAALSRQQGDALRLLEQAESDLSGIEAEITRFVSADALSIARLLQGQLVDGRPCPVCGSPYHRAGGNVAHEEPDLFSQDAGGAEKIRLIAQTGSFLTARRDEAAAQVQSLKNKLESLRNDEKNTDENLAAARNECAGHLALINEELAPWGLEATLGTLEAALGELNVRSARWTRKQSELEQAENELSAKSAERNTLSENLSMQNEACARALDEWSAARNEEEALRKERAALFGERSVDEAESEKKQRVARCRRAADMAESAVQSAKENKARLEARKAQLEKSVAERAAVLRAAEEALERKVRDNGFLSEDGFIAARMDGAEFSALSKESGRLRTRATQAETTLRNAEKSYADCRARSQVTRARDEVQSESEALSAEREGAQGELIEIRSRLQANEQHKARAREIIAEHDALQEEFSTWEQMDRWIGRADGSDMSVFVQSLAFSSLLRLANKNLFGITRRYRVLQKERASLEFEIQDICFEQPRSVANLSGGEKFLVSLSFALAISEFASHNVRVDSLFLDEGFGTLGGELLTEAVNALKNLHKDGKMLGIITHVQDVIDEIDQRIEVRPVSNGHSVLLGAGIARE